jgi:hypothetical protein
MRRSTKRSVWLLQFVDREGRKVQKRYLHETKDDWGPSEFPLPEIEGAIEFLSEQDASKHARKH